jgi:hypothetical protein
MALSPLCEKSLANYPKGSGIFEHSVAFKDVNVNFTLEGWALLAPSQKAHNKDVMWDTFRNPACVGQKKWEDEKFKDWYKDSVRYFSTNVLEKACESKEHCSSGENIDQIRNLHLSQEKSHWRKSNRFFMQHSSRWSYSVTNAEYKQHETVQCGEKPCNCRQGRKASHNNHSFKKLMNVRNVGNPLYPFLLLVSMTRLTL